MLNHERRDELSFSVKWFGCRTFKSGFAFVHELILPSKINVAQFKKFFVRSCNMSCDFFTRFAIWSGNAI